MRTILALHLRQTLRGLRRNPTFTIAVLLTLALAIGANTAVFSVVNGVLLNPLPYPEPESLVSVLTRAPGAPNAPGGSGGITDMPESASMFVTYAENTTSFDSLGIYDTFPLTITGATSSEQVRAIGASHGVLESLRVPPLLGRSFTRADYHMDGRPADNVILGWGYWQRRFGGDPSVIGRTLRTDTVSFRIIGVMPQGFRVVTTEPELLVPLSLDRSRLVLVFFGYEMIGRLKPGVTHERANTDLQRATYLWGGAWPMPPGFQGGPRPFDSWGFASVVRPLKDGVVDRVANLLWVLMATIGIVMLVACANVGNLVLVRSESRQQEFAVRMALGSGRGRLVGGWLVESLVLSLVGGAAGTALAYGGVRLLKALGPGNIPRLPEVAIDNRVLAFALVVSVLSGILFGLIPALKYARRQLSGMLAGARGASDGRDRQRTRNGLVVAQVALALVLLVSSGLMIRTFLAMRSVDPGFDTGQIQTVRISIPATVAATPDDAARMQKVLLQALATIPGVTATALTTSMPMEGLIPQGAGSPQFPVFSERDTPDQSRNRPLRRFKFVSPDFFRVTGTRVIAGREYTWNDLDALRPVAVVSNALAVELWGSASAAVGQRLRASQNASWRQVIGVVEDVRDAGAHLPAPAIMYWPSRAESLSGAPQPEEVRGVALAVRSPEAGSQGLIDAMRQRISSVNASMPVIAVRTMQEVYDTSMAQTSFVLVMLGIAAFMALTLGLVGIYGVVAYAVARRTREVGIRLALGAQQQELRRMFLRHALVLTGAGTAIGLAAAAGVTRVLASLLFAVKPVDPLTYLAVAILLTAATLLASYLPARRASLTNPVEALRAD
jgi:predicted permease